MKKIIKFFMCMMLAFTLIGIMTMDTSAYSYVANYNKPTNKVDFVAKNTTGTRRYCYNLVKSYKKVTGEYVDSKKQDMVVSGGSSLTCRSQYQVTNYWFGGFCSFYNANTPQSGVAWSSTAAY